MPLGMRSPLANTRNAQYILLRQRAYLTADRPPDELTRWPGSSWKSTPTTSSSRRPPGCAPRPPSGLKPSGPITRKAGSRSTGSSTPSASTPRPWHQEAQYKTTYNISIVALEEAKGTLLAYNNIAVAEGPHPRKAYAQARDIQDAHKRAPIPHDGPMYPERPQGRVNPDPVPSNPPPDVKPGERPPLPAPVGPLGPPPTPLPPYRPAGEPPIISQNPTQGGPGARPAAAGRGCARHRGRTHATGRRGCDARGRHSAGTRRDPRADHPARPGRSGHQRRCRLRRGQARCR